MIIGEPEKLAFLVERIPKWEVNGWKNGIMFLVVNGELYPKDLRATTFNSELPDILGEHSAMMHPVRDVALYAKSDAEIIAAIFAEEDADEGAYRWSIPFHEIGDAGFRVYVLTDGVCVKLLACAYRGDAPEFLDKLELPLPEYEAVVAGVREFYNSLTPAI